MIASTQTILKPLEAPDEIREPSKGKFEIIHIGGMTIGRVKAGMKCSKNPKIEGKKQCH